MVSFLKSRRHLVVLGGIVAVAFGAGVAYGATQQPHMRMALASLNAAKAHLAEATPDKGGHRVKAIELVDQAIVHVKAGMEVAEIH